jgi:alpha-tubulin suppressor-like RCC1 family protein
LLVLLLPLAATAHDTQMPGSTTEGSSQVVAVAAGASHTCALQANGSAICWGDNFDGQATPPAPNGPYLSLSAGYNHTCGLRPNGSATCWGSNDRGQATPPTPNGPFLSLTLGYDTCGLKADGSATCWGYNGDGQATPPTPNGPFLSLAASIYHTCGLKVDGSAVCWGRNIEGQATPPTPNGPFLSLAVGSFHTCGLKVDGSAVCWGHNGYGQATPPTPNGPFLSLTLGSYYTCGLKVGGSAVCWGKNDNGQTMPPTPNGPFLSLSAGYFHACGVKADGSTVCWGYNVDGRANAPVALQSAGATGFGQLAAGNAHACQVKRNGTLACWGLNDQGQRTAPVGLFTHVVAGDSHSCAIGTNGKVTCWGRNGSATNSNSSITSGLWRQLAPGPDGALCVLSANGGYDRCVRGATNGMNYGGTYQFRNITHAPDAPTSSLCGVSLGIAGDGFCWPGGFDFVHYYGFTGPWQRLESGLNHQCGLKANGSIECWGDNTQGQTTNVPNGTFRALSVGYNHACAIRDTGTLACWGSNISGQTNIPVGTFVQVAAGNTFTCAIRNDGVRVCWGDDSHGQAPQLALSPAGVPGGQVNVAHAGAAFALADANPSKNAAEPYVIQSPAYAVVAGSLPTGLSLSAAGVLSGTPTAGGSFNFTVEGEDANGFAASRSYTVTIIADSTPPVISYTLAPPSPNGSNGWYTSNIGIAWSVTDPESSISGKVGCVDETLSTDTTGTTRSCTASSAGGSGSVTTAILKRDATAPTINATEASTPDGNNGWYRSNATVHFSCNDATSGVASCPADQVLSSDGAAVSSTAATVSDNAGNNSAASNVVTVKIDKTAPTLAPTTPSPLLRGQSYVASANASDATSGVASQSCGALDTSSLGSKSTTCTAGDNAGNSKTVTLNYTVTTTCANDGYTGTQKQWCVQICESGLTGAAQDNWIHRWYRQFRTYPYCVPPAQQVYGLQH